jgi:hypothetical protein
MKTLAHLNKGLLTVRLYSNYSLLEVEEANILVRGI